MLRTEYDKSASPYFSLTHPYIYDLLLLLLLFLIYIYDLRNTREFKHDSIMRVSLGSNSISTSVM